MAVAVVLETRMVQLPPLKELQAGAQPEHGMRTEHPGRDQTVSHERPQHQGRRRALARSAHAECRDCNDGTQCVSEFRGYKVVH